MVGWVRGDVGGFDWFGYGVFDGGGCGFFFGEYDVDVVICVYGDFLVYVVV